MLNPTERHAAKVRGISERLAAARRWARRDGFHEYNPVHFPTWEDIDTLLAEVKLWKQEVELRGGDTRMLDE